MIVVGAKVAWPTGSSIGYRMFDALYWLCVSFIPGYFVYVLVIYLPRKRDQRALAVFISNYSSRLVGDARSILSELEKASGYKINNTPTLEDFKKLCERIKPLSAAPLIKSFPPPIYANWYEFLNHYMYRSERSTDLLLRYMLYMEAEHVRLVTEIKDCVLFMLIRATYNLPKSDIDLSFFSDALFGYYKLTSELSVYCATHLKGMAWSKPRL
jgi:hypothetical protein